MDRSIRRAWTLADEQALRALRDDAVSLLANQLRATLTPVWKAFGADPQQAARADAGYHLDALQTALACRQPQTWLDYVRWLQQVLVSRGADAELLADSLSRLGSIFERGLPEPTRSLVGEAIRATVQLLREQKDAPVDYGGAGPSAWKECVAFQNALLAGDHEVSAALFDQALGRSGNQLATAVHVIQPALYDIGRQWQRNAVTVTQERMASAIVEALLAQASGVARLAPASGRRIVLARAPGNHHALGLRIVADAFEMAGWETQLLKAPASAESLLPLLREKQPQLLGLSASLSPHLLAMRELLRQLRDELGKTMPRVVVGGLAVNQYPDIARAMGGIIIGPDAESMICRLAELDKAA